jgi:hypothetical protein
MDYTSNRKEPLKTEDPKRRRSMTIARFYASIVGSKDILQTNVQKGTTKQTYKVV